MNSDLLMHFSNEVISGKCQEKCLKNKELIICRRFITLEVWVASPLTLITHDNLFFVTANYNKENFSSEVD